MITNKKGVIHPAQRVAHTNEPINKPFIKKVVINSTSNSTSSRETLRETLYQNKKQSVTDLLTKPKNLKTIEVCTQYVSAPVLQAIVNNPNLLVKSDMGTGKTWLLIDMIAGQPQGAVSIIVANLQALVRGNMNRLEQGLRAKGVKSALVHYEDANEANVLDASAIFTTFNNLPKITRLIEAMGRKVHVLAIDESESGAQFMVSNALNNASEVGQALNYLENGARHILLMDAHLGTNTLAFARAYLPRTHFTLLNNTYSRWGAFSYEWACDSESKGLALIESKLSEGKKLFITATSKERARSLCDKLTLRGRLSGLKVLKAFETSDTTDDESAELKAAKENHALFNTYDVVIASPTIGTGVSIEAPQGEAPHFDCVISFMVRHKDTPDALGALQMPFRVRDTKERHLYLVALDFAGQGKPRQSWQVRQDLKITESLYSALIDANVSESVLNEFLKAESSKYATFEAALDIEKERGFNEYYSDIDRILTEKGMTKRETVGTIEAIDTRALTKELNKAKKTRHLEQVSTAKPLEEKQLVAIETKKRLGQHVNKADLMSLEKANLIKDFHPSNDAPPTLDQLETYIKWREDGLKTGRNNIANSLMTLKEVRLVEKAMLLDDEYKRDITQRTHLQTRANWELDRILADVVGLEFNDSTQTYGLKNPALVLDAAMLVERNEARSVTHRLNECIERFNAANPLHRINRKELEQSPLETVIDLLKKRFKLQLRKIEKQPLYELKPEQPVLNACNIAIKRGVFGLSRLANAMELKNVLDKDGCLNQDTCKRLGVDVEIKNFLAHTLSKIPVRKHKQVLAKYVAIAESPRTQGDNFAPIARANHYLHDVIEGKAA